MQDSKSLLIDWANDSDAWVKGLTSEIIENKSPLSEERIQSYYEELLKSKNLLEGEPTFHSSLEQNVKFDSKEEDLTINSLSNVKGVNAQTAWIKRSHTKLRPIIDLIFQRNLSTWPYLQNTDTVQSP